MAIIVQQDKEPINWFSVISWAIVIGVIFVSGYYLFFVRPPFVEFVLPIKLVETATLAKIKFDPSFLIESEVFKVLEKGEYGKVVVPSDLGRDNPFLNFAPVIRPGKPGVNIKTTAPASSTATSTLILVPPPVIKSSATSSFNFSPVPTSSVPELPILIMPILPTSTSL